MTAPARPRVAIADDSEVTVAGLAAVLAPFSERIEVVGAIAVGRPVTGKVDVALYDPFGHGRKDGLAKLLGQQGVARVAAYSLDLGDDAVDHALRIGASGYLSKTTPARELVDQLEALARGEEVVGGPSGRNRSHQEDLGWPGRDLGLSERESQVVALAALGRRNAEIATVLFVSVDTVKTHLARSFRKLGVHNRTELSALVHRRPSFRRLLPAGD